MEVAAKGKERGEINMIINSLPNGDVSAPINLKWIDKGFQVECLLFKHSTLLQDFWQGVEELMKIETFKYAPQVFQILIMETQQRRCLGQF